MLDPTEQAKVANFKLRKIARRIVHLDPEQPDFLDNLRLLQDQAKILLEGGVTKGGNPASLAAHRHVAIANRLAKTHEFYAQMRPVIAEIRSQGFTSYRQIAAKLNETDLKPPRSDVWQATLVRKIENSAAQP